MSGSLPQMERLIEVLAGRWKCDVTYEPSKQMPDGGTSVGWEECRVGPGRSSLLFETRTYGESGTFTGTFTSRPLGSPARPTIESVHKGRNGKGGHPLLPILNL